VRVLIATENRGKLLEFEAALAPLGWDVGGLEGRGIKLPPETGVSYEENAFIKAAFITAVTGEVALADDSGLEVEALGGEPGIFSARFGNLTNDHDRNLYLLERLKTAPAPRRATFVSLIVMAFPTGWTQSYRGEVEGEILEGPRGAGGFGYDPLFFSPELGKTFAEAGMDEKRKVSHRGRALDQVIESFQNLQPLAR
jgi:XTP/dITP diphosphohydrolase